MPTMNAIVKRRPVEGQEWAPGLQLEHRPSPEIEHPEDVKIRVVRAGICGTDVGIWQSKLALRDSVARGTSPSVVLGHEFCGRPIDAGAHARVRIARILEFHSRHDAAVASFVRGRDADSLAEDAELMDFLETHFFCSAEMHITCGWCHQCRLGQRHVCQNTVIRGIHEDGAFAEYLVVPASNLVLFPQNELPADIIAFMDALGNAVHTVQAAEVTGRSVAVLGSGVQGLMATAVARHSGASHIYVTDASPKTLPAEEDYVEQRLFSLARRFGAHHCFDVAKSGARQQLRDVVMEETGGTGVDVVLEMSGNYGAYGTAFELVRMGGTIALLGLPEGEFAVDFSRQVIFRGVTVKGVIGRRVFQTWEAMRNLLRAGLADELLHSGFISHRLPLEHYEEGFNAILRRDATKVLLEP